MKNLLLCVLFMFTISSSNSCMEKEDVLFSIYPFQYNLNKADQKIILPKILREISGLSYFNDNQLAVVQDEQGTIFIIDTHKEGIIRRIKFENKGDFEGIELVDERFWILNSKGNLYRVKYNRSGDLKVKKYKTELRSKNNTEGLGYDAFNNRLLITCKSSPNMKESQLKQKKAIYGFDLKTKKLIDKPVYLIDIKHIDSLLNLNKIEKIWSQIARSLNSNAGDFLFKPSAIAIHPITSQLYILSAKPGMLLVLNQDGDLNNLAILPEKTFNQAEGICFDPLGNLYISNEGGKYGQGNILKFNLKHKE